ncbi:hypothetical protein [Bufonid herpesvirus 1]|uniref:hypothetical protein n=1 Tax=Bufonid herpesvirus 1 TaxID=2282206 RepID=UPI000EB78FC7|nr:hypothetical protein [Bufonid herpesvirus 1]AXF48599.1 hypothetical protein [Bufonid herpesvirus 1]
MDVSKLGALLYVSKMLQEGWTGGGLPQELSELCSELDTLISADFISPLHDMVFERLKMQMGVTNDHLLNVLLCESDCFIQDSPTCGRAICALTGAQSEEIVYVVIKRNLYYAWLNSAERTAPDNNNPAHLLKYIRSNSAGVGQQEVLPIKKDVALLVITYVNLLNFIRNIKVACAYLFE